jgi:holo-[acyl-carrier protein] synthase
MTHTVVGFGVDVVEIAEFDRIPFEANRAFYERCFSAEEIKYCQSRPTPSEHFAARYAAKEAAVKATSSITSLLPWHVEVTREASGGTRLRFWDEARSGSRGELAGHRAFVSLSHSQSVATAVVMLCKESA